MLVVKVEIKRSQFLQKRNYITVPEEIMNELIKREGSIILLKTKRDTVKTKIYETLIGLNSLKKIKEIFPEAYALIPVEEERNLPLVINNVSTLVSEIKNICNG